jgi:hypothetical protein
VWSGKSRKHLRFIWKRNKKRDRHLVSLEAHRQATTLTREDRQMPEIYQSQISMLILAELHATLVIAFFAATNRHRMHTEV